MKIIDLHSDTILGMKMKGEEDFENNDFMIDLTKLKSGESYVQALGFFDFKPMSNYDYEKFKENEAFASKMFEKYSDKVVIVKSASDIKKYEGSGKQMFMLTKEDIGCINGSLDILKAEYDYGFRIMSLTWNFENCVGYGNTTDVPEGETDPAKFPHMNDGLKPFGKEAVEYMNELGIIPDCSHLSDGGFWDLIDICKGPFIASHSNCREVCGHVRNLTDEMIRAIADKGGVSGLNFCPEFIDEKNGSTIEGMVRHLQHFLKVGGEDILACGTDSDGIGGPLEIPDFSHMQELIMAMEKAGFTERQIEKFGYKNAMRVFEDVLG